MAEKSNVTLTGETMRHLKEARDIWLHEGAKDALGKVLYRVGKHESGQRLIERLARPIENPRLATSIGGLALCGPTGLAAGHDKLGYNIQAWQAAGANFLVLGGVTWDEQLGNPMPRLHKFRRTLGDFGRDVGLNFYGFNSPGRERFMQNVADQREIAEVDIPIFIQVTLNKEMYDERNFHLIPQRLAETARYVSPYADGISLGLSSPNTLKMREAQDEDFLYEIIMRTKEAVGNKPIELKGDGDGGEERCEMYCEVIRRTELDIISLINSTALARIKAKYGAAHVSGGLSGGDPEYQQMAVDSVAYVYETVGDKVDIIGTGGIAGPQADEQAIRLVRAGASALGRVTGIARDLVRVATNTDRAVLAHLETEQQRAGNVMHLPDIIGADTHRGPKTKVA
jgi:dihydroorotate dehydrogenase